MVTKRYLAEGNAGGDIPLGKVIGLLDKVASLIEELTPYLDHILSDSVTADQRRLFRDHVGPARVFDLSNHVCWFGRRINALCSEHSRHEAIQRHGVDSTRWCP